MLFNVLRTSARVSPGNLCPPEENGAASRISDWPGRSRMTGDAETSRQLGLNEGTVKVAIHRLRRRFREVIKNEISRTVNDRAHVDAELHCLLEALL